MTAWAFCASRFSKAANSPSSANGCSGTRQKFTSWLATVAAAAMKPAWRPISFTTDDAVVHAARLGVRAVDHPHRLVDRGAEAEGAGDEAHVVVDGLGDADHRERVPALPGFLIEIVAAALRAVAADGEEDVHSGGDEEIHGDGESTGPREVPSRVPPFWWMSSDEISVSSTGGLPREGSSPR